MLSLLQDNEGCLPLNKTSACLPKIVTEGQLDSHVWKNDQYFPLWFVKIYTSVSDATRPLCFDLGFTDGRLNSDSLYWCSSSVIGFADLTRVSLTNLRYCSSPSMSTFLIVFQTVTFMLSLVARTKRSSLSSRNGRPISSTTEYYNSYVTSFTNVAWTLEPGCCSWW